MRLERRTLLGGFMASIALARRRRARCGGEMGSGAKHSVLARVWLWCGGGGEKGRVRVRILKLPPMEISSLEGEGFL